MAAELTGFSPHLIHAVSQLRTAFEEFGVQYALIGGIAVGARARPRATRDVDYLLSVPQLKLPGLLDELIRREFELSPQVVIEQYVQHHITAFEFHGVRIDWMKPVLACYAHILDLASETPVFGEPDRVATVEGLILMKLTASRPRDLADIAELLASSAGQLDLPWIENEWCTLFDTSDERWQQYLRIVREFYERK